MTDPLHGIELRQLEWLKPGTGYLVDAAAWRRAEEDLITSAFAMPPEVLEGGEPGSVAVEEIRMRFYMDLMRRPLAAALEDLGRRCCVLLLDRFLDWPEPRRPKYGRGGRRKRQRRQALAMRDLRRMRRPRHA